MAPNHADATGSKTNEVIDVDSYQSRRTSKEVRKVIKAQRLTSNSPKKQSLRRPTAFTIEPIIINIDSDSDDGTANGPIVIDLDSDVEMVTKNDSQAAPLVPQKRPASFERAASTSKRSAIRISQPSASSQKTSRKHKIDGDPSPSTTLATPEHKLKKPRVADVSRTSVEKHDENESNPEYEFENYHAGFDVKDGESWRPCTVPLYVADDKEDDFRLQFKSLTLKSDSQLKDSLTDLRESKRSKRIPSELLRFPPFREHNRDQRLWNILSTVKDEANKSIKRMRYEGGLFERLSLRSLKLVSYTKQTSGCPTKIAQRCKTVAVSCASIGGGPEPDELDPDNYQPDPYNREGNLVIWYGDDQFRPSAHQRRPMVDSEIPGQTSLFQDFQKFYTVNDVAFDPLRSDIMVTSGMDCVVRVWKLVRKPDDSIDFQEPLQIHYRNVPNDLSFRPNSSILGVSNYDGCIHIVPNLAENMRLTLKVSRDNCPNQKAGAFLWGRDLDLFASSESLDNIDCRHAAFNIERQKALYEFNTTGSGDNMALDAAMNRLALMTNGGERHTLSIYDVGRQLGRRPIHSLKLAPAVDKKELEINSSSFSPDGIFLAIARNDDTTHVYDSRYMDGELYTFCHRGPRVSVEKSRECGTIGTIWHEGPRGQGLGLITGGVDGCVRFWDMSLAAEDVKNGAVVVQVDHDVACISLGDPQKGEHRLVVGDFGGGVYIYD